MSTTHVSQRIGNCLRLGGSQDIQLERFVEALYNEKSGLTYPALTGVRKQSVEDVERLFGAGVVSFMKENNYAVEEKYVRVVRNWRRALDEHGLSTAQRQQYRKDMLCFILDKLMPWHTKEELNDYSLLEVNRYVYNVICIYSMYVHLYMYCIYSNTSLSYSMIKFRPARCVTTLYYSRASKSFG